MTRREAEKFHAMAVDIKSQGKKLPPALESIFHKASAILRGKRKANPGPAPTKIYHRLLRIEAQKGNPHRCDPECAKADHCYYHDFGTTSKAQVFGLPNGDILIRGAKRLWGMF